MKANPTRIHFIDPTNNLSLGRTIYQLKKEKTNMCHWSVFSSGEVHRAYWRHGDRWLQLENSWFTSMILPMFQYVPMKNVGSLKKLYVKIPRNI